MKNFTLIILIITIRVLSFAQGTSCATAIDLNPYINQGPASFNFTATTSTSAVNCTTGNGNPWTPFYQGQGRVIYFRFTHTGGCLSILSSINTTGVLEAVVTPMTCMNPNYMEVICFNDGYGYWAMNSQNSGMNYVVGTSYIIKYRLQAGMNAQLTLNATTSNPNNHLCTNAVPLTPNPVLYNNSCNMPTPNIQPGGVCALSIENTAWYTYTITGDEDDDLLNMSGINCDNFESNTADWGYQVGIFTGSCGNLQSWGPCFQGEGGNLQWPLSALPVGTTIYIAVDGMDGSNCLYYIWAGTGPPPLPVRWGTLVGIAESQHNLLRWSTLTEMNSRWFIVERSYDGQNFEAIDTVNAAHNSKNPTWYSAIDPITPMVSYYRIKAVDVAGQPQYSSIIKVQRGREGAFEVRVVNPVQNTLKMYIESRSDSKVKMELYAADGRRMGSEFVKELYRGINTIEHDISRFAPGIYIVRITLENETQSIKVLKR